MSDHSTPDQSIQVFKRDGSAEPFVLAKLLACIRRGLLAAQEGWELDTSTAGGLGEAVYEYLKSTYNESAVTTRQLAELVELVLSQTGHTAAAMAIREHDRHRDRLRRIVLVATSRPRDDRIVQQRWNKGHIMQHLRRQHGLNLTTARMIAGRVEELIFSCGLRVVTSGLVREMARSEMLAWGLLPGALVVKRTRGRLRHSKVRDNSDRA